MRVAMSLLAPFVMSCGDETAGNSVDAPAGIVDAAIDAHVADGTAESMRVAQAIVNALPPAR